MINNNIEVNEELCGVLWPYVQDENVTDIKWNGHALWINDLNKGRYVVKDENDEPLKLDDRFLEIFCSKIANANNVSMNYSTPSLMAETPELRIQAVHPSVTGNNAYILAIRKTPAVARLLNQNLVENGYMDELTNKLIPCLVRARLSGIVTGDVGAGKTELQKWMISFIPQQDGIATVEDALEMKADILYPEKDIVTFKYNEKTFDEVEAIKTNLRLVIKWLILAEARGEDIKQVLAGSTTGCKALATIHAENTWEIPDRIMNMIGNGASKETKNDVFTFFNYAIKVKQHIDENGIKRNIDQISFFYRENEKNYTVNFIVNGQFTGEKLPAFIFEKINAVDLKDTDDYELPFLELYDRRIKELERIKEQREAYGKN